MKFDDAAFNYSTAEKLANRYTESGDNNFTVQEIFEMAMPKTPFTKKFYEVFRRHLPSIRRLVEKEFGAEVCFLSQKFYDLYSDRDLSELMENEARACVAGIGRGARAAGMHFDTSLKSAIDPIWAESIKHAAKQVRGKRDAIMRRIELARENNRLAARDTRELTGLLDFNGSDNKIEKK